MWCLSFISVSNKYMVWANISQGFELRVSSSTRIMKDIQGWKVIKMVANRIWRFVSMTVLFMLLFALFYSPVHAASNTKPLVTVLSIDGAIGPAVQDYVEHGIVESEKLHAQAIVLTLDTPGGLDTSMRGINKAILHAAIPVIGYVYPSGARAASAGTYILYACHIAAMSPGTNLGAATPISIVSPDKADDKEKSKKTKSAAESKAINDAKAYIRSLAQLRHRNEQWAVKAVTEAQTLSANEALKLNVINVVAPSLNELLQAVNGKTVQANQMTLKLNTQNANIQNILPTWRNQILKVITDPSIAYILLMIGVYGLFFEFMNPGYVAPGVIGAIALLIALYAFQLLPINYAGFILVVLGIIFMVAEAFLPSFGALGLGGIVSFIIGSFLLFETDAPGLSLPWQLIIGTAIATSFMMIGMAQLFLRSRYKSVVSGVEMMIGKIVQIEKEEQRIWAIVNGERWKVKSDATLQDKQQVKIVRIEGLVLIVEPIG